MIASSKAAAVAQRILLQLNDACVRAEVGGGLRRGDVAVEAIQIVAVPSEHLDMFGEPTGLCPLRSRVATMLLDGRLMPLEGSLRDNVEGARSSWVLATKPEGFRVEIVRVLDEDFAVALDSCCT